MPGEAHDIPNPASANLVTFRPETAFTDIVQSSLDAGTPADQVADLLIGDVVAAGGVTNGEGTRWSVVEALTDAQEGIDAYVLSATAPGATEDTTHIAWTKMLSTLPEDGGFGLAVGHVASAMGRDERTAPLIHSLPRRVQTVGGDVTLGTEAQLGGYLFGVARREAGHPDEAADWAISLLVGARRYANDITAKPPLPWAPPWEAKNGQGDQHKAFSAALEAAVTAGVDASLLQRSIIAFRGRAQVDNARP